ncbi:LamG-like jellyroll fold domain-containing protein [Geomonas azotofigens]|uniref:LamG-like jellyroll fold domain-containing protein n=1 Tax=Geomonas azotofigens TaxID=2843196 RepID=UPI001C1184F8|nr:LamG-like jellyroll fold domain-containing protein [Geomonas azotofigens]MBU5613518.1 hypothetical protein [Geomonas azotofigens]
MDSVRYAVVGMLMLLALITVPVSSMAALSNATDPDLVGIWHMDGGWSDTSGNSNNGTGYNGVAFSTNRKVGSHAGSFDGINDYVTIPDAPSLNIADNLTIEGWIYPRADFSGYAVHLINKWGGDSRAANFVLYYFGTNSGQPRQIVFCANAGGVWKEISPRYPLSLNQWYHIALSYSAAGGGNLYVNGVRQGSPVGAGSLKTNAYPLRFGSTDGSATFNGLVDEVAIYKRALTAEEIAVSYGAGVDDPAAPPPPVLGPTPSAVATNTIALAGTSALNTSIWVNNKRIAVTDASGNWTGTYGTLQLGANTLDVTALDAANRLSKPTTVMVSYDSVAPAQPTVAAPLPLTTSATLTLTGTKEANSWLYANNEQTAAPFGDTTWSTTANLSEGSNNFTFFDKDAAGNMSGTVSVTVVRDTTAPAITTSTPAAGAHVKSVAGINATLSDTYAGVDVQGSLAGATVKSSAGVAVSGIWSASGTTLVFTPAAELPDGNYTVTLYPADSLGNKATTCFSFTVDSTPPVLTASTLPDGSYTNNDTLNIAGSATDESGVQEITVNDNPVTVSSDGSFSYPLLLKNGANVITTAAKDFLGNRGSDTRTVTLDQAAPVLTINTPADNSKTAQPLLTVSGTVDKTSFVTVIANNNVQAALMDGGNFSATLSLVPGYNTIEITATDLAGNKSAVKRTVVLDNQMPSLAVTVPNQDVRTNKNSLAIHGTVFEPLTAVNVTVGVGNDTFTPTVSDGAFDVAVNLPEEKTYAITVTATNEVGASATVQRNVIYDITPPALSITQVSGPTSEPTRSVSGTREAGLAVTVTCATAAVGEISYPTATTWQVNILGLKEGENIITAASADAAGNVSTTTATTTLEPKPPVVAVQPPQITISASPAVIWPPSHKKVPVKITGGAEAVGSTIKSVSISVTDEYGKYMYRNLSFGSTVMLEAWRNGNDKDGRKYTITAVVTNLSGQTATKTATVTVPHNAPSVK